MTIQTATASRLDETTATAIRRALGAAQSGGLKEACAIAEAALANGADLGAINALLGTLRLQLGDVEAAVRNLELAHEHRPEDIRIATNLANALVLLGRHERALEVASRDLAFVDPSLQLARIRGFAADQLLDFDAAVEALEHVVAAAPTDWESWNNLGNARRAVEDWEGSLAALKRSVEINPLAAPSRLNYARMLRENGHYDEAEAEFNRMAEEFPKDANPYRELYVMLKNMRRDDEAVVAIERAVSRAPEDLELLLEKASHFSFLHKMEASEATYRRVLRIDRTNSNAYLGLALVYELSNRDADLAALVDDAVNNGVEENAVNFIRAYHYRRTKDFEAGLAALETVPEELENPRRKHLLGQLLEGAGRYDEAFEAFSRMNEIFREDPTNPDQRGQNYRNLIRDWREFTTEEWAGSWRDESEPDARPAPVFLVGFPRSGTTLLDTILMGHPQLEVLEEEPPLRKAQQLIKDLETLPAVSDEEIRAARQAYFDCAAELTPLAPGKTLIDKNPLTMNLLPFVRRIFPDARVILALRHPCDVVLSCFVANFSLNDGMASFLQLDTAADLYDASFSYYEHVQSLMPLSSHAVVYENVVSDRERELRALFEFLGVEWHDDVLDHQKTAKKRGRIKTASYAQVVEPIYTRSAGRWEKYRRHLEPVLPVLKPWIEKFGYSA